MYAGMALPLSRNFAVAATDTGHPGPDAAWALGHPQKVLDYGYRGIHETAVKAKAIIQAFYGNGPQLSYFSSCSNGGRQALMEAQRYPEDYNGIIVGAPANFFTHLLEGFIGNLQALSEPGSYIPHTKLKAIEAAALAACDARDGVTDGVIEDPRKCNFDPTVLLCKGPESDSCLTEPQLTALKKLYAGPKNSQGVQVFPGYPPGGENGKGGWGAWVTGEKLGGSLQAFFGTQAMTNMVFENRSWDYKTFNFDKDMKVTDDKMSPILNATDPNLKPFARRGGKLIMYHGWNDAAIAPQNAINYFESVVAKLGHRGTDKFMRLYMVPGLEHCDGGPGPNVFGEGGAKLGSNPQHDIELALEGWVEKGVAPGEIIATKYVNDADPSKGVQRTRPLCAYPLVAHYKGTGSTDEAANFVCAKE
jgi:feruloyl esterase